MRTVTTKCSACAGDSKLNLSSVNIPPRLPCAELKHTAVQPLPREPVAPAASGDFQPPNERLSPQGSVEAQCGLVLNGQGGVIRRGKALVCLSSVLVPEAVNTRRHDSTRLDTTRQRAAGRQTGGTLLCCLLSAL